MPPQRRSPPAVPAPLSVAQALRAHQGLAQLQARVHAAKERLECVRLAIPRGLHAALQAGPVDEDGWTLLVHNAAAAAKLRQLRPHLEMLLAERFGAGHALRIKLLSAER